MKKTYLLLLLLLILSGGGIKAQQKKSPFFRVTGAVQVTHEYYQANTENYTFDARKPENLSRLIFNPTFQLGKLSLPFTIALSSQGTNTLTPPSEFSTAYALFNEIKSFDDLKKYVQNPINRIGFAPKYKGFQVFLGTHTPTYSELTQGNISVFGAGFNWQIGNAFFVGANVGNSQHAIAADSTLNIAGAYERQQYGARLGVGNPSKSFLAINLTGGRDRVDSLQQLPIVKPQEGLNASLQYRLNIKKFSWEAEAALGIFSENTLTYKLPTEELGITTPSFLNFYTSTMVDNAASSSVSYKEKSWGLRAKVLYVGMGYKTFGYPFFQSDRLEWTISPNLSLFKQRVNLSGSIGSRTNNLSNTRAAATSQLLASANLSAQLSDKLSLSGSYSNFGIRNVVDNDTFKVENVAQNISLTPVFILDNETATDIFTLILSLDNFEDYNVVSGALNNNDTRIAGLTYNRSFKNSPLSLGANYMFFQLKSSLIAIDNSTIGATAGYNFFDNKINTTFGLSYLLNRPEATQTYDKQLLFNLQANYQNAKRYFVRFQASNNAYAFGSARPGARLTETNIRIAVGKRF